MDHPYIVKWPLAMVAPYALQEAPNTIACLAALLAKDVGSKTMDIAKQQAPYALLPPNSIACLTALPVSMDVGSKTMELAE